MMLASGQVCYGCSKAGTSPLWFGVTVSDQIKTPTHNTRNTALEMAAQLPALQSVARLEVIYYGGSSS